MFHPLDGVIAGLSLGKGFAVLVQHHSLQRILHPAYCDNLMQLHQMSYPVSLALTTPSLELKHQRWRKWCDNLKGRRIDGAPMIVPSDQFVAALSNGKISFQLSDDFLCDILAVIDIGEALQVPEEEPVPETPAEADSEALHAHQQRLREESRLDFQSAVALRALTPALRENLLILVSSIDRP